MDLSRPASQKEIDASQAAALSADPTGGRALALFNSVRSGAAPLYWRDHMIAPIRTIGSDASGSLKASFWYSTIEDSPQVGDPGFVSVSLRTSPATAWRNSELSGPVTMLPFEGAHWRFEQPVSFMQIHLPFSLPGVVCEALFDRELVHCDLRMPADVRDAHFSGVLRSIQNRIDLVEPTNLLLDSWALMMSEAMLRRLSSHGDRHARASFGKIPGRGVASVIDYIEAAIDQDLRLSSLAGVAAMSVYHFARSFKETVGMSPHAYVLSRRIARARTMLSRSDGGLADIAQACGFSSQAHLTTAFRHTLGVTPAGYRRSVQI